MAAASCQQDPAQITVCSLEVDDGVRRIRVWAWLSRWNPFNEQLALDHARYLRRQGRTRVWVDRLGQPAIAGTRTLDYLSFAEQRARAVRRRPTPEAMPPTRRDRVDVPTSAHPSHPAASLAPALGVHIVGALRDGDMFCVRCGALLACNHSANRPAFAPGGTRYVPGAFLERGHGWQAMSLRATEATCRAAVRRTA